MRLFRFDAGVGRPIADFGSVHLLLTPIARLGGEVQIVCMHLAPGGHVGEHEAVVPQLFLVVEGAGWATGQEATRVPIAAGRAAFWRAGERHAAGSETGMVAIVIEAETLDPSQLLVEVAGDD
ncbi:MAG TPA: hypothetical protein VFY89_04830 [Ktedonobacterales bacterium]